MGAPQNMRRWLAVALAILVFEVFTIVDPFSATPRSIVVDLLLATSGFVAAEACRRRSLRERRRQRRGWQLLAGGTLALAIGQLVFAAQVEVLGPGPQDSATLADLILVISILLIGLGLVTLTGRSITSGLVTALDAATIALSCILVGWVLFLGPVYRTHAEGSDRYTTMFYIVGSLALAVLVLMLAARWRGEALTLALLVTSFVWASVSSSAYGVESVKKSYRTGDPLIDVGWFAALLLLAIAASRPTTEAWEEDLQRQGLLTLFVPYGCLLVAAVTTLGVIATGRQVDTFLRVGGATILLLVLVRQAVALMELHALNEGLESRVEERAADVRRSEAQLTVLLRNSSDVIAMVEGDGTFSYLSPAIDAVLGYASEEMAGHHVLDLVHPADRAGAAQVLDAVSAGGLPTATLSARVAHRDGQWRSVEATASPLQEHTAGSGLVLNIRDVTERAALENEMRHQASYDALTALANRRLLNERVRHALDRASRSGESVSVLFVDLDHFKRINDTAGHAVGDQVLVQVADRLRQCLRPSDTAARLGGDEFAVLLEDTGTEQAQEVADRVVMALAPVFTLPDRTISVTASVGVTTCTAGAGTSDGLLREADVAMYQAKAHGRAQAAAFHPEMHSALIEQMELETGLRRAIEDDRLRLEYQPLVDLRAGTIVGVEALLRWAGKHDNDIPPALFIPLAEERGLIHQLDVWVLTEACRQIHEWHQLFPDRSTLRVNVNLSALELREPGIVEQLEGILEVSGLDPRHLMLEITETALLPDPEAAADVLRRTRELGVGVSLDDFGVGNSSLAMLGHLPVDAIKIDQSFIAGIEVGPSDRRLLRAIIEMAQALDLETVAEAVETPNQLAWLRRLDCGSGQGYLFSPPLSSSEMSRVLSLGLDMIRPASTNGIKKASAERPVVGDAVR